MGHIEDSHVIVGPVCFDLYRERLENLVRREAKEIKENM